MNYSPRYIWFRLTDILRKLCRYRFPRTGSMMYRLFFRTLPSEVDTELLPGIWAHMDFRDGVQRATYWQGERFEWPTPQILATWTDNEESIFFDIGSNYGWFSLYLTSRHPDLAIHAFEPNPSTFQILNKIASRNHLNNLQAWPLGLSNCSEKAFLALGEDDSGHSTFGPHPDLKRKSPIPIQLDTFDAWRSRQGLQLPSSPKWVAKIDVEGFESKVLIGMREALSAQAFAGLVVEINPSTLDFCGTSPEEIDSILRQHQYRSWSPSSDWRGKPRHTNYFYIPMSR